MQAGELLSDSPMHTFPGMADVTKGKVVEDTNSFGEKSFSLSSTLIPIKVSANPPLFKQPPPSSDMANQYIRVSTVISFQAL